MTNDQQMKSKVLIFLVPALLLTSCSNEPEPEPPLPDPIRSYFMLLNFLVEPYNISWEINGNTVESGQGYGIPLLGYATLSTPDQEVLFTVRESGTGNIIQSDVYQMKKDQYHIISTLGTEDHSYILFEPHETDPPESGLIRIRFMQAAPGLDPVDVYVGGKTETHKVISGLSFTDIGAFTDIREEDAWHSVLVTPHGQSPMDTVIFSFTENEVFEPDHSYLGVIAHVDNDLSTSVQMLLYDQPVEQ